MPVPLITANTRVTALDWWNPLSQLANTNETNLAAEISTRAAAITAINNRLNSTIAGTGISDLPTWKTATDASLASEASTRAAAITAINNRLNSTIALTGISDLPTWKTSVDGSISSHLTSINALNTAVGMPYGAGTSLSARTTALEAATGLPPYLHAYQLTGAVQSIANNAYTAITFTGEIRDTANTHSNVSNTSRCTPSTAGYYECHGIVSYVGAAAGMFQCQFRKNGAQVLGSAPYGSNNATNQGSLANSIQTFATIQCNGTTDYIELWTWHNFGGAVSTYSNGSDEQSVMIVRFVGA